MFLGKDNFVTKHQGKEGSKRTKRGGPICRVCFVLVCFFWRGEGEGGCFCCCSRAFLFVIVCLFFFFSKLTYESSKSKSILTVFLYNLFRIEIIIRENAFEQWKKTQIKVIIIALVGPLITGPSSIHQKTAAKA